MSFSHREMVPTLQLDAWQCQAWPSRVGQLKKDEGSENGSTPSHLNLDDGASRPREESCGRPNGCGGWTYVVSSLFRLRRLLDGQLGRAEATHLWAELPQLYSQAVQLAAYQHKRTIISPHYKRSIADRKQNF